MTGMWSFTLGVEMNRFAAMPCVVQQPYATRINTRYRDAENRGDVIMMATSPDPLADLLVGRIVHDSGILYNNVITGILYYGGEPGGAGEGIIAHGIVTRDVRFSHVVI